MAQTLIESTKTRTKKAATRVRCRRPDAVPTTASDSSPKFTRCDAPHAQTTFSNPALERDFVAYCQMVAAVHIPESELEARRTELSAMAVGFRHLEEFDLDEAEELICGVTLLEPLETSVEVERWKDAQGMFASMCATRVLSVAEEKSVMRRMHFLKYLAWKLLASESVDQWVIARCQGLLRAAHWHRDLLVQANVRLVVSIVKKLPVMSEQHDELISEGIIALLRAVDKFDPSRGYRLCTYATPVIRRECFQYIHELRADQGQYASAPLNLPSKNLDTSTDRTHWIAWRKKLIGLIGHLSRREQLIIRSRYCLGPHRQVKTLQRLAAALKISKERVRQLEHAALAKLRALAEAQL